jgi:hypothetical protein
MIRFLVGCLLAIAVLWAALITIGFFAMIGNERNALHQPAAADRRNAPPGAR